MTQQPIRLGGFKIMKGMTRFSLVIEGESGITPALFLKSAAEKKINFPYLACMYEKDYWAITMLVESDKGLLLSGIIEDIPGRTCHHTSQCAVLSIFPHKKDPLILKNAINALDSSGARPESMATSLSAISIVFKESDITAAGESLFGSFSFSTCRSPEDCRLAQEGKEHIYKEIIATYQEKRPKVYGLECYSGQSIERLSLGSDSILPAESGKKALSIDRKFTIAASCPSKNCSDEILKACFSSECTPDEDITVFSMTGPHFGDRYGICYELLKSLERRNVSLLCLSCTIASITGAVASPLLDETVNGIKDCFEVPMVVMK